MVASIINYAPDSGQTQSNPSDPNAYPSHVYLLAAQAISFLRYGGPIPEDYFTDDTDNIIMELWIDYLRGKWEEVCRS